MSTIMGLGVKKCPYWNIRTLPLGWKPPLRGPGNKFGPAGVRPRSSNSFKVFPPLWCEKSQRVYILQNNSPEGKAVWAGVWTTHCDAPINMGKTTYIVAPIPSTPFWLCSESVQFKFSTSEGLQFIFQSTVRFGGFILVYIYVHVYMYVGRRKYCTKETFFAR